MQRRTKQKLVCALTGGIGSGKSTIATMLQAMPGIFVIDSDCVAKDVVARHWQKVCRIIGIAPEVFSLALTARIIFSDPRKKALLEDYIHPLVKKRMQRMMRRRPEQIVVIESALIFERKWEKEFDLIIAAICPRPVRIARVRTRNNWTRQKVLERMKFQVGAAFHRKHATIVIETDCRILTLRRKVKRLYRRLVQEQENLNV